MFWIGLLACVLGPPAAPPSRPTLGVAVPLSGPDAALGAAALDGVALALGTELQVLAVDDTVPGAVARLAASPDVFGVVAHVVRGTAEKTTDDWLGTDLPVVTAAAGSYVGIARVVPPIEQAARCAAMFLDAHFWVRTDGSPGGMIAGQTLMDEVPRLALNMDTVDPAHAASQAAKMANGGSLIAWAGAPGAGGNYLRALRATGWVASFLGVGLYDQRFLDAAGASAEGARVTSMGRPARSRAFVDAFVAKHRVPPSGPAVDAYEAATLLVAAWRAAGSTPTVAGSAAERAKVRASLATVVADGANGPMYLGSDGVLQPVVCATFVVKNGAFSVERIASEADLLTEAAQD